MNVCGQFGLCVVKFISIEVFAFGGLPLFHFQIGSVEKCDGLQNDHGAKEHQQNFKEKIGVEAVGGKPDCFNIPFKRA